MRHTLPFVFASLALALVTTRSYATAEFPGQIVSDQSISCANPIFDNSGCTICHTDNNGGIGTAVRPFGRWARQNGLTPFNDSKLSSLLTQLQNESPHTTDTNCDGTPDIDELTSCQWPNLTVDQCGADGGSGDAGVPVSIFYGCSTAPAVGDGESPALPASIALAFAGLLAAVVIRAKSRKR